MKFRITILNYRFKSKKFLIKKKLFSFLKLNEAKRNILNRRKRINVSRFYRRLTKSTTSLVSRKIRLSTRGARLSKTSFFSESTNTTFRQNSYHRKGTSELFLPRVKFKPGYQRI